MKKHNGAQNRHPQQTIDSNRWIHSKNEELMIALDTISLIPTLIHERGSIIAYLGFIRYVLCTYDWSSPGGFALTSVFSRLVETRETRVNKPAFFKTFANLTRR